MLFATSSLCSLNSYILISLLSSLYFNASSNLPKSSSIFPVISNAFDSLFYWLSVFSSYLKILIPFYPKVIAFDSFKTY